MKESRTHQTEPSGIDLTKTSGTHQTEPSGTHQPEPSATQRTKPSGTLQTESFGTVSKSESKLKLCRVWVLFQVYVLTVKVLITIFVI